jgi:hypothetical protein
MSYDKYVTIHHYQKAKKEEEKEINCIAIISENSEIQSSKNSTSRLNQILFLSNRFDCKTTKRKKQIIKQ